MRRRVGVVSALCDACLCRWRGHCSIPELPGRLGTVRLTLEPHITESKSLPDYIDRLERATMKLTPLTSRGADIVFLFARTPRWLARTKDEALVSTFGFTRREATPPNDSAAFAELVYQTVGVINGNAAWRHGTNSE